MVGSITIGGNGIGTRAGYFEFRTNMGRTYKAGTLHTPYIFQSNNGFLTGFYGLHGNDIDALGITLMKEIRRVEYREINYPYLQSYSRDTQPKIYISSYCNDTPLDQPNQQFTWERTKGEKAIFSNDVSFAFGQQAQVQGGVPFVAQASSTFYWDVGYTRTWGTETNTLETFKDTYSYIAPNRTRTVGTFSFWDSRCDVDYTASMVYSFRDGSSHTFRIQDRFEGAYIQDSSGGVVSTPLANGETCD